MTTIRSALDLTSQIKIQSELLETIDKSCIGCPYGKDFEFELEVLEKHEPKLYIAANNIFGDAYEYTRKFNKFREEMKNKELTNNNK